MLVEVLPQVVAKASEPLSAVDKLTVISTEGAGQLPRTVANNVVQGLELLTSTTGVDVTELLRKATGGAVGKGPDEQDPAGGPEPARTPGTPRTGESVPVSRRKGHTEITD
jgi:flotillin